MTHTNRPMVIGFSNIFISLNFPFNYPDFPKSLKSYFRLVYLSLYYSISINILPQALSSVHFLITSPIFLKEGRKLLK